MNFANDSPFGLGGFAFTKDIERGKCVTDQSHTRMFFIDHPTWVDGAKYDSPPFALGK